MQNPVRQAIARMLRECRGIERKYGNHRTIIARNKVIRHDARLRLYRDGIGWEITGH